MSHLQIKARPAAIYRSETPFLDCRFLDFCYYLRTTSNVPLSAFSLYVLALVEMRPRRVLSVLSMGAVGLLFAACPSRSPDLSELAQALKGLRLVEPRLAGGFAYSPCRPSLEAENRLSKPHCSDSLQPRTPRHRSLVKLVARIEQQANREHSANPHFSP